MLAPWKKICDLPRQYITKQTHYFSDNAPSSESIVFPVVMYGYENWTMKKSEH